MIEIHPVRIDGRWLAGVALDYHTTRSIPIGENEYGHMQFETVRPPVAELLYKLKYRQDYSVVNEIVAAAVGFLGPRINDINLIVPVPPSNPRPTQPVLLMANGIGAALGIPVACCVTTTRATSQLKNVTDPSEREALLAGLYAVDARYTAGKNILLFDDLFRSGSTMNAITDVLLQHGRAASVRALTITRTRSNQ